MKRKYLVGVFCIFAMISVVTISVIAFSGFKNNNAEPVHTGGNANGLTDISSYNKKIAVDVNANMPSAEVISMGGNGLQLYDTEGNFISGDTVLDCQNELQVFLRVIWLENHPSDLSLVLLVDNHVQMFRVDDSQEQVAMLNLSIQAKSLMNIPLSVDVIGDATAEKPTITFLLLSNNVLYNESDEYKLPNSTNGLQYKIANNRKQDFSDRTLVATDFVNQNSNNDDFVKSESFYSVLSSKSDEEFTFYKESPLLSLNKAEYHYFAMGRNKGFSLMFINDKLISAFDNKPYLSYSLEKKSYLKQKVDLNLSDITEGDRLMIINMEQGESRHYSVVCHNLSVSQS